MRCMRWLLFAALASSACQEKRMRISASRLRSKSLMIRTPTRQKANGTKF